MKLLRKLAAPAAIAIALGAGVSGVAAPVAGAADVTPAQVAGDVAQSTISEFTQPSDRTWVKIADQNADRVLKLKAYSPSMGRDIPLAVIPATDPEGRRVADAPTIYLLNGAGGAEQNNDWFTLNPSTADHEGTIDFYSGKGVNVVIPMAGAFSYYMDWLGTPNSGYLTGPQKWETFLTKELPGPIENYLDAGNQRGIIGFSMSATSALLFAAHNTGFYDAAGAFSGCYSTSTPITYGFTGLTLDRGGSNPQTMLGPLGGSHNLYNDALVNAAGLRGTEMYISNGSGLAGETDMAGYYTARGVDPAIASANAAVLQFEGGIIEAASNGCTHDMKAKLDSLGIPADWNFRNTGTHSWPSWRDDLQLSWPTFERAFFG